MSDNNVSTGPTAKSRQHCQNTLHLMRREQQQQQHCNSITISNANKIDNNWQHRRSIDATMSGQEYHHLCQKHAAAKSPNSPHASLPRSRANLPAIDVTTPPRPLPLSLPLSLPLPLRGASNCCKNSCIFKGTTGCNSNSNSNSTGINNNIGISHSNTNNNIKGIQILPYNSALGHRERESLLHHSQSTNMSTQTEAICSPAILAAIRQHRQRPCQTTGLQSPLLTQRAMGSGLQLDFLEACLTPPPPPSGCIPAKQQQCQQPANHSRPHLVQHSRAQSRLQHSTPSKMSAPFEGGSGGGSGGGGSGGARAAPKPRALSFDSFSSSPRRKNLVKPGRATARLRLTFGISLGLIFLLILVLTLFFVLREGDSAHKDDEDGPGKLPPTAGSMDLTDLLRGKYHARGFNATWSSGKELMYIEGANIVEYNVATGRKNILISGVPEVPGAFKVNIKEYTAYQKSADGLYLLLQKNVSRIFRYSTLSLYDIYDIGSKQISPLHVDGKPALVRMAEWAPVGNALIFHHDGDLYYKSTAIDKEIAITSDGSETVYNGIPDWVYEEEIFGSDTATYFNTDGTMIAFIRFDESPVGEIDLPLYGSVNDLENQYPRNIRIYYPKAGTPNPRVKLFTANLMRVVAGQDALTQIPRPSELNTQTDNIITMVQWLNKQNVLSIWTNRIQNVAYIQTFDGVRRTVIYNVESKTGWLDLSKPMIQNRDGSRIALILPRVQGEDGSYQHLCLLATTGTNDRANPPQALTNGKYTVTSLLRWDPTSNIIFYAANTPEQPEDRHIYAVRVSSGSEPKCLTCKLETSDDVEQTFYTAVFSTGRYVAIMAIGPEVPRTSVYEWSYKYSQVSLKKIMDWESNDVLREKLDEVAIPTVEIHNVPLEAPFSARVMLKLPPNMDRSGKTKYPMLVEVYGGPGSSAVTSIWSMDWGTYLSVNASMIMAKIDGRGTNLRGDRFMHSIYLKLGTLEIQDQIDVTRYLQQKFDFIDENRIGIWGWSYGGYASAMALARDDGTVFQCAASVAPVTDWIYYDSMYTERFMSTPGRNQGGYANASLIRMAQKLRGKTFLLVHGTLDDNVHFQQTLLLERALEVADILFKQITYADETHNLATVRPHLYHSLNYFFGECLGIEELKTRY